MTDWWQAFLPDDITTGNLLIYDGGALWNSTVTITRVQIAGGDSGLVTGSQLRIYGRL